MRLSKRRSMQIRDTVQRNMENMYGCRAVPDIGPYEVGKAYNARLVDFPDSVFTFTVRRHRVCGVRVELRARGTNDVTYITEVIRI